MPRDHGSSPNRAKAALLLIDAINDLECPDAEALLEQAIPMAKRLAELKRRPRQENTADETSYALRQMSKLLKADIRQSNEIDFKQLGASVRE